MCSEGYEPCKKCSHTHCLIKQGIIMFTGNSFNFTGKFPPIVCIFPAPLYASNEAIFHPNVMRPLKHQISNKINVIYSIYYKRCSKVLCIGQKRNKSLILPAHILSRFSMTRTIKQDTVAEHFYSDKHTVQNISVKCLRKL
jgi:hypothetical protein